MRGGAGGKGSGRGGTGAREPVPSVPDNPRTYRRATSGGGSHLPASSGTAGHADFVSVWGDPRNPGGSTNLISSFPVANHQSGQAGRLFAISDLFGRDTTIRQVGLNKQSSTGPNDLARWRVGLYTDAGATCYPGDLVWDSGDILIAPTGGVAQQFARVVCGITLRKGRRYWLSWNYSTEVLTVACNVVGMRSAEIYPCVGWRNQTWTGANGTQLLINTSIGNVGTPINGWAVDQAYGAMPAIWPGSAATAVPLRTLAAVDLPAHIIGVSYP